MNPKKIDYKNRVKRSFEAIITIVENNKDSALRDIKRIALAQLVNVEETENKDKA